MPTTLVAYDAIIPRCAKSGLALDDEHTDHAERLVAGFGAVGTVAAGFTGGELKRRRLARLNQRGAQVEILDVPVVSHGTVVADAETDPLTALDPNLLRTEREVVEDELNDPNARVRRGRRRRALRLGRGRALLVAAAPTARSQQQRQHQNGHEAKYAPPSKHNKKPLSVWCMLYAVTPHTNKV